MLPCRRHTLKPRNCVARVRVVLHRNGFFLNKTKSLAGQDLGNVFHGCVVLHEFALCCTRGVMRWNETQFDGSLGASFYTAGSLRNDAFPLLSLIHI